MNTFTHSHNAVSVQESATNLVRLLQYKLEPYLILLEMLLDQELVLLFDLLLESLPIGCQLLFFSHERRMYIFEIVFSCKREIAV